MPLWCVEWRGSDLDEARIALAQGDEGPVSVKVVETAAWWLRGNDVHLDVVAKRDILASGGARKPPVNVSRIPCASFLCSDACSIHTCCQAITL
jgi:hypothetical protein